MSNINEINNHTVIKYAYIGIALRQHEINTSGLFRVTILLQLLKVGMKCSIVEREKGVLISGTKTGPCCA